MRYTLALIFFLICSWCTTYSQDLFLQKDLSSIKASQFSDSQIQNLKYQLEKRDLTIDQLALITQSKGIDESEFDKIKLRLKNTKHIYSNQDFNIEDSTEVSKNLNTYYSYRQRDSIYKTLDTLIVSNNVFGSEMFNDMALSFEPNQNQPTPANYILGPGDQLEIVLFGEQQFNQSLIISKNGKLILPNIGSIHLSGLQLEPAISRIKQRVATIFKSLKTGGSQLSVSISKYRTINVTIIGSAQPGNYNLSSMSTVFNALFVAGGPNNLGSYRIIELIRNNQIIKKIDLYDFLVKGDQSANLALKDNDLIRIPTYNSRVYLAGQVKTPAIYEILPGETLEDIVNYASGFTEEAYKNRILVTQKTDKELKIIDLNQSNYKFYQPKSGDVIRVDKILNRYRNRVQIKGAVYRPGNYSLSIQDTLRVKDLIEKADGLKENVFLPRASLIRQTDNLTKEYISVNLKDLLNGDQEANLILQKEDVLVIYYDEKLLDTYKNFIEGEVRFPGNYNFFKGKTLYDLLLEAGYFTDKASKRVDVYRRLIVDEYIPQDQDQIKTFNLTIDPQNPDVAESFLLSPLDYVIVRRVITSETPSIVTVKGQVSYPGKYALIKGIDNITNIIERAGGFNDEANLNAIKIVRAEKIIPINWSSLKRLSASEMLRIEPDDVIEVPEKNQTVSVQGQVMLETELVYEKGKTLRYYLKNAGGTNSLGAKNKIFVTYSNGSAANTSSFLGFKFYPKIKPGSTIMVPTKPERDKLNLNEVIGVASTLATLGAVLLGIFIR
ncbi:protein involved in polysaccharide export, contains SLBB domain of the beta-grasp fold [Psychroflexus salarius]|uniref:Protein involved in polysaccharide export, contains SLBB domain of the beta-grasp fold n=1 Tax=Psychroflexus salarius TaxID=1155689 RepID=A0A1M4WQY2_9FLAO|nr:SLBB domain-containing protein [Psychroflexus salarius]SHE83624.1 protein involved in polysaccharide export, contains SLBB domain of the beta-grasp fold [Psychroflexus salarius]